VNPFYCEGPAHDNTYSAPVLGYADHPEHVHVLCSVCALAAREAQAEDGNTRPLHQYITIGATTARSRLEAGEKPDESPPLNELPAPPAPKKGPLAAILKET